MEHRRPARAWAIFLVIAAAIAVTIVLLIMGAQGAQIAAIIALLVAVVTLLATVYPLLPQPSSEAESSNQPSSLPRDVSDTKLFYKTRHLIRAYQVIEATVIVLAILAYHLYITYASPAADIMLRVTDGVTLLQQDDHLNYQRALVFQLSDGQYGYLARPDDRWWRPWSSIKLAPDWPGFTDTAVFASWYTGLEFLGLQGDTVMFTYRDNALRWYDPSPILVNGLKLMEVNTTPGFMQYTWTNVDNPQFLAMIPSSDKGLELYERIEKRPWGWVAPIDNTIGANLGNISAVSSAELADGSLYVVVRADSHLFELTHPRLTYNSPNAPPDSFGEGWSTPKEIRSANGAPVTVSGDPQLIATGVSAQGTTNLLIAAPVPDGAILLSNSSENEIWNIERLPINHDVDALTLLNGNVGGRDNLDVTYRQGDQLLYIWRWDNGPWHEPAPVEWGTGS
jgi:hypothetical protein